MLLWRKKERRWFPIGEGLTGLPIGFIAGEIYTEQSVRVEEGLVEKIQGFHGSDQFEDDFTLLALRRFEDVP